MGVAAKGVLSKLQRLPTTRAAPVDTEGIARIIRSSDGILNGQVLLEVLLALKSAKDWRLSMALARMVELSSEETVGASGDLASDVQSFLDGVAPNALQVVDEDDEDDEDEDEDPDDVAFRRSVRNSPNFAGSGSGGVEPHPMASLLGLSPPEQPDGPTLPVDTIHYNVLIATCAAARKWQEALSLLVRMRERGVPRDTVTYNTILHALDRGRRSILALRLFRQMRSEKIPPNTVTFSSVIAACARAGDAEQAKELLEMAFSCGVVRNTVLYTSAIAACERAKDMDGARHLLEQMVAEGIEPDAQALNAVAAACASAGDVKACELVAREAFAEHGLRPDRVTYNTLLSAFARATPSPQVDRVRETLSEMDEKAFAAEHLEEEGDDDEGTKAAAAQLKPNVVSLNSLLHALGRAGRIEELVAVLHEEMPNRRLRPDAVSYTTAVQACNMTGEWERAVGLIERAEDEGVELGTLAYSKAIGAVVGAGRWQSACALLDAVSERGLPHNPFTVNLVLAACAEAQHAEAAEAGLAVLRHALDSSSRAASIALGPRPTIGTRGPPADRETVELTRRLLFGAGVVEEDEVEATVQAVEKATLKLKRSKRVKKMGGRDFRARRPQGRGRGGGRRRRGRGGSM